MAPTRIYLDHAATSPLRTCAREALNEAYREGYGNPGSPHREGQRARAALEWARTQVAHALEVPVRSVVFTGGGSDALRLALIGAAHAHDGAGITSGALEHPAVMGLVTWLAKRGHRVRAVPMPTGVVDPARFHEACQGTDVAVLTAVQHETGLPQPIGEVARALTGDGCVLVCDAALAPGRVPLPPICAAVPLVALSAHKFGGPPGIGILAIAAGTTLRTPSPGGVQEEGLRAGMPDVAGALAAAAALDEACAEQKTRSTLYATWAKMLATVWTGAVQWVGGTEHRTGIHTLAFDHVDGESMMITLDLAGVAVATGSSCILGGADASPSLQAMGWTRAQAACSIRISFGWSTTDANVKEVCARLSAL